MMMWRKAAVVAVLVASCLRPASADSLHDVRVLMTSAMRNVKSFQLQISSSALGLTSLITLVFKPLQMHMEVASGAISMDAYVDQGYFYQNMAKSGWKKTKMPAPDASADVASMLEKATRVTLGGDVSEDGTAYGTLVIQTSTAAIPGVPSVGPVTITCSYDKTTFLAHICKNDFMTMTFLKYNDPENVISIPAELGTAPDLGTIAVPHQTP